MRHLVLPLKFNGMSDEQWGFIEPLLPPRAKEGKPRADDRTTINAILYVLKTGMPWNDLPKEYGDDVMAWRRLKEWDEKGVWKGIMDALVSKGYSMEIVDMDSLSIDSDTIPAKKGGGLVGFDGHKKIKGTKVHAAVTEGSLPVAVM